MNWIVVWYVMVFSTAPQIYGSDASSYSFNNLILLQPSEKQMMIKGFNDKISAQSFIDCAPDYLKERMTLIDLEEQRSKKGKKK